MSNDLKINIDTKSTQLLPIDQTTFEKLEPYLNEYINIFKETFIDMYLEECIKLYFFKNVFKSKDLNSTYISQDDYYDSCQTEIEKTILSKLRKNELIAIHNLLPKTKSKNFDFNFQQKTMNMLSEKAFAKNFKIKFSISNACRIQKITPIT